MFFPVVFPAMLEQPDTPQKMTVVMNQLVLCTVITDRIKTSLQLS
jgi:hypothetical protein